jgi:hypothetical protein
MEVSSSPREGTHSGTGAITTLLASTAIQSSNSSSTPVSPATSLTLSAPTLSLRPGGYHSSSSSSSSSPPDPLQPSYLALARTLIVTARQLAPLSPREKVKMFDRIRAIHKTPLSLDLLLSLARLSPRQLKRLPKGPLVRHDRLIVIAIHDIRKEEEDS